jgi:hypothetical protein
LGAKSKGSLDLFAYFLDQNKKYGPRQGKNYALEPNHLKGEVIHKSVATSKIAKAIPRKK